MRSAPVAFYVFLWIAAIVIWFVIWFAIAKRFQWIAKEKGYLNNKEFFWWTFLLAIIGMLMVIALPDLSTRRSIERIASKAPEPMPRPAPKQSNNTDNNLPDI